jgi:hypothetical protein
MADLRAAGRGGGGLDGDRCIRLNVASHSVSVTNHRTRILIQPLYNSASASLTVIASFRASGGREHFGYRYLHINVIRLSST